MFERNKIDKKKMANSKKFSVMDMEGVEFEKKLFIKQIAVRVFDANRNLLEEQGFVINTGGRLSWPIEMLKKFRFTELLTGVKWGWYDVPGFRTVSIEYARSEVIRMLKNTIPFAKGIILESQFLGACVINNVTMTDSGIEINDIGSGFPTWNEYICKILGSVNKYCVEWSKIPKKWLSGKNQKLLKKYGFLPHHDPCLECIYFQKLVLDNKLWEHL